MNRSRHVHQWIAPVALIVTLLGAADWYLAPERAVVWLAAIATMAAIWLVVGWLTWGSSAGGDSQAGFLAFSAVAAGVLLAVSLGDSMIDLLGIGDPPFAARTKGLLAGLLLLVIGNLTPKILGPVTAGRCESHSRSAQRFVGWTFVLAGFAYVAVWLFASVPAASRISTILCASAVALVLLRCLWAYRHMFRRLSRG